MKILFIFTGGTIGSTLSENVISADADKSYQIIHAYSKQHGLDFDYDVIEPYTELSENNTGEHIRRLTECVLQSVSRGYDGIIVTHGTDTLQYSAAAIGYAVGLSAPPICIVSSNRPIEHERTNALDNLHGAVCFIRAKAGRGTFVVYRNDRSKTVRVHRATRLVGGKAYADDVSSILGEVYGQFEADFQFVKNAAYREAADETPPLSVSSLGKNSDGILVLFPYPGMVYPALGEGVSAILMNTYHSGTVDTKSEAALRFFREACRRGIPIYVTGVTDGPEYESASLFGELGVRPLRNLAPIAAYMKLWLLTAAGLDVPNGLSASLSGDILPAG